MNERPAAIISWLSFLIGSASLLLFGAFLFFGSITPLDLGLSRNGALIVDTCLSLLFFIQHSVMIRRSVRAKLRAIVSDDCYGAFFSIASGIALIIVVAFWQELPRPVYAATGAAWWALRALFFLCIAGFFRGVRSLDSFDPYGVARIRRAIRNREQGRSSLSVRGAYRWVRHPLYFLILVMIWSYPEPSADRLLFNGLWSGWILIASRLEERDLVADFGDAYLRYRKKVPMIIPWKIPR